MSLPQSLSRSLIPPMLLGNLVLIPPVNVLTPPTLPPSLLRLPPGLFVWFLLPPGAEDESEERTQTSCLLDLEDGDKCGFRLFQGTHISHAWEGALGLLGGKAAAVLAIAMVRRGRRGGGWAGGDCHHLSAGSAQPSLTAQTVKMSPSHLVQQLRRRAGGGEGGRRAGATWDSTRVMFSRGVGLTTCKLVSYSDS